MTCRCPRIDGFVIRRKDCPHHEDAERRAREAMNVVTPAPEPDPDAIEAACAWADYRKDYGLSTEHMKTAHSAFLAGWKAAREGDQSGVLR